MTDDILHASHGRPKCLSLVICDSIIEDKHTNSKSLIGIFSNIWVSSFPAVHGKLGILVSLSEGHGTWPIIIRLVSPSGTEIARAEGTETFADEREVRDVALRMFGIPITEIGNYAVDVLIGDSPTASRYFNVQKIQGAPPS